MLKGNDTMNVFESDLYVEGIRKLFRASKRQSRRQSKMLVTAKVDFATVYKFKVVEMAAMTTLLH